LGIIPRKVLPITWKLSKPSSDIAHTCGQCNYSVSTHLQQHNEGVFVVLKSEEAKRTEFMLHSEFDWKTGPVLHIPVSSHSAY